MQQDSISGEFAPQSPQSPQPDGRMSDPELLSLPRPPRGQRRVSLSLLAAALGGELLLFGLLARDLLDARAGRPPRIDAEWLLLLLVCSAGVLGVNAWLLWRWFRPLRG